MEIKKLIDYVNRTFIASDYLREPDIYYFMDLVIDDINERLQAKYPNFTGWIKFVQDWNSHVTDPRMLKDNTKYDVIPDEYLRTVVALGTATKFYTRDEEGEQIALDYQNRYERALFNMVRDYHIRVEPWFQDNSGGFIDFTANDEFKGPWDYTPRGVWLNGDNTRIL